MSLPVRAFVAIGANLENPEAKVRAAFTALEGLPRTRLVARSSLYRTAPVGVTGQPDFINAVAAVDTTLTPRALLTALLELERAHGRRRDVPLAPRTLDLDLILHGEAIIHEPDLSVPHPRAHLRAFVLVPLAEIAPALVIPGAGPVAALLAGVADQAIERL
ncbi:MAG: 2-amino-4-hydroxy-6-hydroxymethyldihydropteridine diphosphokinase [Rhodocyclaceae bacterium]|jgi:2-amino-4-hydroxy-6-hydroxymethyldihydropteridine diphosphokinase|nr:2-amino-4-hydroxy-6-hydroxymethyldihydropteridine diphosphokinase [Rhodocyclaceae bacterium]